MRILLLLISFVIPAAAMAETPQDGSYLGVYTGAYDLTQQDDEAALFGLEYRHDDIFHGLRPGAGVMATTDKAVYGYGGFFWDLYLTDYLIFTPNVVAGAYTQGDGKDLGHALQFRSGLELSYQMGGGDRFSVNFNHMSNASIGNDNPGTENLMFYYQFPLSAYRLHENKRHGYTPAASEQKKRWWE